MARLTKEEALTLIPGDKLRVESAGNSKYLQAGEIVTFLQITNCRCCCTVRMDSSGRTSARYFHRFSKVEGDWWDIWGDVQ